MPFGGRLKRRSRTYPDKLDETEYEAESEG